MVPFFAELLRLSISGSLFVLAVVLLRLVFRKAPKWVFCMLWGLTALHLVLPFTIRTNLSVLPEPVASGQILENLSRQYVGEVEYIYPDAPDYSQAVAAGRIPVQSETEAYIVTQKGTLEAPETVADTVLPVLAWAWLAGFLGMVGYTGISYGLLKRKMATATLLKKNIRQSEQVKSPFVLGLVRPVIYLPYRMAPEDMEPVIAHEKAHIRRKDHWWKPLGFLVLSLYWFNPLMWLAYILLCRDIEAACDEKVIRNMDREAVRAYSKALLNCSVHRRSIAACPLAFGEVGVKERISRVMHYRKPAFWIVLLAVTASVVAAVLLLTAPEKTTDPQVEPTESTEPSLQETKGEEILALVDKIADNPAVAASSNPYDYIDAGYEHYVEILRCGETAREILLAALRESPDNGLREYIMAAACAELTGFGLNKELIPWGSGKEWLRLFDQSQGEYLGTEEDTVGGILGVDSLLGIDCVAMRIVAVEDHPYRMGVHRYSYRFQYYGDGKSYDWDAQEWYLVEIHSCLDIKMGDFDHDGIVELFYHTDTEEYPYYICDRVGDSLVEEGYTLVPDAVLDYDMLLNSGVYYLYAEQWAWFLKDPVTYVQEVAKLPRDRLVTATPNGIIPAAFGREQVAKAYQTLVDCLKEPCSVFEKQIVYRIMTVMEYTYKPELRPGQIDHRMLFEKWGFTRSMSTEEKNCYAQLVAAFDLDPSGFIREMAHWEEFDWAKDMHLLAGELAKVGFLYDGEGYVSTLNRLEEAAQTEKERELVAMLRDALEYWNPPALDYDTLMNCSGEALWTAFYYAPDHVLEILASNRGYLGNIGYSKLRNRLSEAEGFADPKLLAKGCLAVDRILAGNPTKAQKDTAYAFLMSMELLGADPDVYVPGAPFDYGRLFDKLTYADGHFTENYLEQAAVAYEDDPGAFLRELTVWAGTERQKEIAALIAQSFAQRFLTSETYLKILLGLADGMEKPEQKETVNLFIAAYRAEMQKAS